MRKKNTQPKAPFLLAITVLVSIFMIAPMLLSVMAGLVNNYSAGLKSGLTLRWLGEVWENYGGTVGWSLALALILAYGQLTAFRQSFAFILVGHMVFTLPFMVRTVSSAFQRDDLLALEEAARSLGANFRQRFMGILVPAVFPAIVAGSLMVFTLSVGEFNLTWMLHTPLTRTLPVGLADSYASMRIEIGSAYTLVFFAVILPVLWGLQYLANLIQKRHGT